MAAPLNFEDALEFLAITYGPKADKWIANHVPPGPGGVLPSPSQMKDVILRAIAAALGVRAPTVKIQGRRGGYNVVDWPTHRQTMVAALQSIHAAGMKQHALMATPAPGAVVPAVGGSRSAEQAALDAAAVDAAVDVTRSSDRAVTSHLGSAAAAAAREKRAVKQTIDAQIAAAHVRKLILADEGGAGANAAPGGAAAAADAPPVIGAAPGGADGATVDTTGAAPARGGTSADTDDGGDPADSVIGGAGAAGIVKQ